VFRHDPLDYDTRTHHPAQGWPHDDCAGPRMPCPRCNTYDPPCMLAPAPDSNSTTHAV